MSKETEFNFSKIDNGGPMLSPGLSELRQDILAFNDGIESSSLSDEDLTEVCLEAQEEFDNRWPYMDKPMILSGYISPTYFNEGIDNLDFLHDEQIYVDDKSITSKGFLVQQTEKGVEIGYLFSYVGDEEIEIMDGITLTKEMTGWARVDQVSLTEFGVSPDQARENLEREAPDVIEMLDDVLLNADPITDAIKRIGKFRLDAGLPLKHRLPFEWGEFSIKKKREYVESTFNELKNTIELYITSKLDMYEPVPYTIVHSGFLLNDNGNIQYNKNMNFFMMPEDIMLVPKHQYLGDRKMEIIDDIYIPALQGQVSFPDKNHHSGYTPYSKALVLMDQNLFIESNLK